MKWAGAVVTGRLYLQTGDCAGKRELVDTRFSAFSMLCATVCGDLQPQVAPERQWSHMPLTGGHGVVVGVRRRRAQAAPIMLHRTKFSSSVQVAAVCVMSPVWPATRPAATAAGSSARTAWAGL